MGNSTDLVATVEGNGAREKREDVLFGQVLVPLGRDQIEQILVIRRQLRLPDGVRRRRATERTVEPCKIANLRRSQVQEHARHAALRYVPEAGTSAGGRAAVRSVRQARERRPHSPSFLPIAKSDPEDDGDGGVPASRNRHRHQSEDETTRKVREFTV